jgi:hypothetical protein
MTVAEILLASASACSVVLGAWTLHKIRRVHLMLFEVAENARQARFESSSVYRQVESLDALQRLLDLPEALPPLRGWAGSPDFLLALARHVMASRPRVVFECSSGSSTLVLARCLQLLGEGGRVVSLEHETSYAAATRALLARHRVDAHATILEAPLQPVAALRGHAAPWYSTSTSTQWPRDIEMVVVDGPPGQVDARNRFPALPVLHAYLARSCSVFVDDANRADERSAVDQWQALYPEFEVEDLDCEKGAVRLWRMAA